MKRLFLIALVCCSTAISKAQTQATYTIGATTVNLDLLIHTTPLLSPWDIEYGFDDNLWFTDATFVRRYNLADSTFTLLHTFPANNYCLGLAIAEDTSGQHYVFVVVSNSDFYTTGDTATLHRFEYDTIADQLINDTILLTYPHFGPHSGGKLIITPDHKLLLTTAEYQLPYLDSLGGLRGKTLRMNFDGSISADNFRNDYTYSWGHRNPQGLCITETGAIYASEHGESFDNEINRIKKGRHHGWPVFDGQNCNIFTDSCISTKFVQSVNFAQYEHDYPPAGLDYFPSTMSSIPELQNTLIQGVLGFGVQKDSLMVLKLNATADSVLSVDFHFGGNNLFRRVRDVEVGGDGRIYLITNDRENLTGNQSDSDIKVLYNPNYPPDTTSSTRFGKKWKVNNSELHLSPNPATSSVSFSTEEEGQVQLYNTHGQLLHTQAAMRGTTTIDVSTLPKGLYIITLSHSSGTISQKLLVE